MVASIQSQKAGKKAGTETALDAKTDLTTPPLLLVDICPSQEGLFFGRSGCHHEHPQEITMLHKNDKQNQRKHLKMYRRLKRGKTYPNCKWHKHNVLNTHG